MEQKPLRASQSSLSRGDDHKSNFHKPLEESEIRNYK